MPVTFTNAGEYTVRATIAETDNYNGKTPTADFTIAKATATATAPTLYSSMTYYGNAIQLIRTAGTVTAGQGTMYYAVTTDNSAPAVDADVWKTAIADIKATSSGTYYIWYKVEGATDYVLTPTSAGSVSVSPYVAPSKSNQYWTLTMNDYKFDGTAHTPTISNGTTVGTVSYTYFNADTNEELDEAPSAIGNYKVMAYARGNSSYYSKSVTVSYSILNPIDENGMADVEVFKDNDIIPESEGKLFAGWFTDSTCTAPYTSDSGEAYAKFIDKKVLTVKAQISSGTTAGSTATSIRFITSVDSLKYQNVGFKITFNGKTINQKMTKVYTAINANGAKVKPTVFSADSHYMEAYMLNNIPKSAFDKTFTVTPYYTTQDGTIVDGTANTFTIANMIK